MAGKQRTTSSIRKTWRYGVVEHAASSNNLTGFRFRSEHAARRNAEKLRLQYPHACVCLQPPRAIEERWKVERTSIEAFHVTYWSVCEDRIDDNGLRVIGSPLSVNYAFREDAERALVGMRSAHPNAQVYGLERFFNPNRAEDHAQRAELLSSLVYSR